MCPDNEDLCIKGTCRDLGGDRTWESERSILGIGGAVRGFTEHRGLRGAAQGSGSQGKHWTCHCAAGSRHRAPLRSGDMTDRQWKIPGCAEGKAGLRDRRVRRTWLRLSRSHSEGTNSSERGQRTESPGTRSEGDKHVPAALWILLGLYRST